MAEGLLRPKQSTQFLRRKASEASLVPSTASDQKPREFKSAPYLSPAYARNLEHVAGIYMSDAKEGPSDASRKLFQQLLVKRYTVPERTIFSDNVFEEAVRKISGKNEARVVQDIARLLVPSGETLATLGEERFESLVESVNESWGKSIPATGARPQPDYAVGYDESAFPPHLTKRLGAATFDIDNLSPFMATWYMQFPFFASEVRCGDAALNIADRQNAHSMGIAARGIVELFKLVDRQNELHREILTFSVSHDHRSVRLYGYYPIINDAQVKIHRHEIYVFDNATLNGRDKWTTRNFTLAVYEQSLRLRDRLISAIDDLPADWQPTFQSEPSATRHSRLSQPFAEQSIQTGEELLEPELPNVQQATPETSSQAAQKKKQKR